MLRRCDRCGRKTEIPVGTDICGDCVDELRMEQQFKESDEANQVEMEMRAREEAHEQAMRDAEAHTKYMEGGNNE